MLAEIAVEVVTTGAERTVQFARLSVSASWCERARPNNKKAKADLQSLPTMDRDQEAIYRGAGICGRSEIAHQLSATLSSVPCR